MWIRLYTLLWFCALRSRCCACGGVGAVSRCRAHLAGVGGAVCARRYLGARRFRRRDGGKRALARSPGQAVSGSSFDRHHDDPDGASARRFDGDEAVWLPFDVPVFVDRFLARTRPGVLVLVERELWPGLVSRARAMGVPVVLVSGRLGARSASRYARIPGLRRTLFESLTLALCQDAASAQLRALGVDDVRVAGSLKASRQFLRTSRRGWPHRRELGDAFVIVAGSVHPPELDALLAAFVAHRRPLAPRTRAPTSAALRRRDRTLCGDGAPFRRADGSG